MPLSYHHAQERNFSFVLEWRMFSSELEWRIFSSELEWRECCGSNSPSCINGSSMLDPTIAVHVIILPTVSFTTHKVWVSVLDIDRRGFSFAPSRSIWSYPPHSTMDSNTLTLFMLDPIMCSEFRSMQNWLLEHFALFYFQCILFHYCPVWWKVMSGYSQSVTEKHSLTMTINPQRGKNNNLGT